MNTMSQEQLTRITNLLKAGKKLELSGLETYLVRKHLDECEIPCITWFETMDGNTMWVKLIFSKREYPHRYIMLGKWMLELDTGGEVIGRITSAPIIDRFDCDHKDVFWDNRDGEEFDLQVGDQWVPPEGYPN